MKITIEQVNQLRQATGAGVVDCKNALTASNGNFTAAVDSLRVKGMNTLSEKAVKSKFVSKPYGILKYHDFTGETIGTTIRKTFS